MTDEEFVESVRQLIIQFIADRITEQAIRDARAAAEVDALERMLQLESPRG